MGLISSVYVRLAKSATASVTATFSVLTQSLQVYAPVTVKISEWLNKIGDDFAGALLQWESMRGWTFVHNQHDGLPPDVAQAILKIKGQNLVLTVEPWPPSRLLELSKNLTEERLIGLFGHPPREQDMRTLDRSDIAAAVGGLTLELASWRPGSDLPLVDPGSWIIMSYQIMRAA